MFSFVTSCFRFFVPPSRSVALPSLRSLVVSFFRFFEVSMSRFFVPTFRSVALPSLRDLVVSMSRGLPVFRTRRKISSFFLFTRPRTLCFLAYFEFFVLTCLK